VHDFDGTFQSDFLW